MNRYDHPAVDMTDDNNAPNGALGGPDPGRGPGASPPDGGQPGGPPSGDEELWLRRHFFDWVHGSSDRLLELKKASGLKRHWASLQEAAAAAEMNFVNAMSHLQDTENSCAKHRLPRGLALGLAVALGAADGGPLSLAAQSLGLDDRATKYITALFVTIGLAAMFALEITKRKPSQHRAVEAAIGVGFLVLVIARYDWARTTLGTGVPGAALQAIGLTALSLALVMVGAAILGHAKDPALAQAEKAVAKAAPARTEAHAAVADGDKKFHTARTNFMVHASEMLKDAPAELDPIKLHDAFVTAVDMLIDRAETASVT